MNPADQSREEQTQLKLRKDHFGPEWITRPEREWPTWEGNSLTSTSLADLAEEQESITVLLSITDTGLNNLSLIHI